MLKLQNVRRLGVTLVGAGALTAALTLPANAAGSATDATVAAYTTWTGKCEAILYINGMSQVSSGTYQSQTADNGEVCMGWLMRSMDGGVTWYKISDYHYVYDQGASSYTGWYWDGAGYLAKACVVDSGVDVHCTQHL